MVLKKVFNTMLIVSLLTTFLAFSIHGQDITRTHTMTADESSLMQDYRAQESGFTAPPSGLIRNIAEFEPMEGVLIAYQLGIPVSLVKEMAEDTIVTTIVSSSQESSARSTYSSGGVNLSNCNFLNQSHDSYWTRDYGPWYIAQDNSKVAIVDFTYNRPRPSDNAIPGHMGNFLNLDVYKMDLEQAGGNYMTDGLGISVSTDLVWDENNQSQSQIRQTMKDYLGITNYHVTKDPLNDYIKHVDCWGKYLGVDKILIASVPTSNPNYNDYEEVAQYFANQTTSWGNKYEVYRVPSPNKQPYTNSTILNNKVLVPISGNSSADNAALQAYRDAMPGYEVLGFTGSWQSTDALHCRTKGIADRKMVYIKHTPLFGERIATRGVEISAELYPYSGLPIASAKLYYQVNGGAYTSIDMTNTTGSTYTATLPNLPKGSKVGYYLEAEDTRNVPYKHPYIGAPDPHEFTVMSSPEPRNLALEAYGITASGEYSSTYPKEAAIDGNPNTVWGSTTYHNSHYLIVDLMNVDYTRLTKLTAKFYDAYYGNKAIFGYSNDMQNWDISQTVPISNGAVSIEFAQNDIKKYRYVGFLVYKADLAQIALGVREFEIWGE